jgi:hypothetical protein
MGQPRVPPEGGQAYVRHSLSLPIAIKPAIWIPVEHDALLSLVDATFHHGFGGSSVGRAFARLSPTGA